MKTKRGRAAVLRRPNWGKAAALPYPRTGLWGQERNLGLHEPVVLRHSCRHLILQHGRGLDTHNSTITTLAPMKVVCMTPTARRARLFGGNNEMNILPSSLVVVAAAAL